MNTYRIVLRLPQSKAFFEMFSSLLMPIRKALLKTFQKILILAFEENSACSFPKLHFFTDFCQPTGGPRLARPQLARILG